MLAVNDISFNRLQNKIAALGRVAIGSVYVFRRVVGKDETLEL